MRKHVLVAAMLLAGTALAAAPAGAAGLPQSQAPAVSASEGLLLQAQWWRGKRCGYWRRECADRWGWGTWRFRGCLWRHGCGAGRGRDYDDDHRGRRDRDHDDDHGKGKGKGDDYGKGKGGKGY